MKKLAALSLLGLLTLTACGSTGSTQADRPYTITLKSLGYKVDTNKITITETQVELHSAAGAPDVRSIDYTAVLLNSKGQPAAANDSTILSASGNLMGRAKGGYVCQKTLANECMASSPDAVFIETGPIQWPQNVVVRAMMPVKWAVSHINASSAVNSDTAGWYAEFTFKAVQSNGTVVSWKQNYQIVAPA